MGKAQRERQAARNEALAQLLHVDHPVIAKQKRRDARKEWKQMLAQAQVEALAKAGVSDE